MIKVEHGGPVRSGLRGDREALPNALKELGGSPAKRGDETGVEQPGSVPRGRGLWLSG